jgi:DNA-binding beta-propeller fold protein YncE
MIVGRLYRNVAGSPAKTGTNPWQIVVDPRGSFAYVPNVGFNDVSAYTIDPTSGELQKVKGSLFAAGTNPLAMGVDPTAKFAYVANLGSNNVSAYAIDATTGALTPITGSPFKAGRGATAVTVDPSGKFAYVANQFANTITAYTIDAARHAAGLVALPRASRDSRRYSSNRRMRLRDIFKPRQLPQPLEHVFHLNVQKIGAASTLYRIAASSTSTFISFSVLNLMQYPVTLALPNFFPYVWAKYVLSLILRI